MDFESNKLCNSCGSINPNNVDFCIHCGSNELIEVSGEETNKIDALRCNNCGNIASSDNFYCENCGSPLPIQETVDNKLNLPSEDEYIFKENSNNSKKSPILVVCLIAICGLMIFAISRLIKKDDEEIQTTITESFPENTSSSLKKEIAVGQIIEFGEYEQDGNLLNGEEPLQWKVLDVEGNNALLITYKLIDYLPYNTDFVDITWENSSLRRWMNGTFLNSSFISQEKDLIIDTTLQNFDSSRGAYGGNNTVDKIFALSLSEVRRYFSYDRERIGYTTLFAQSQNHAYEDTSDWWWLRSPGETNKHAALVSNEGNPVEIHGDYVDDDDIAVRPAMWISID